MQIEYKIKEYLLKKSKGVINLSFQDARHIINMVTGKADKGIARAELYRWTPQKNGWELLRVMSTTNEKINEEIFKALERGPIHEFYKYLLFNTNGELEGQIFTISNNLFDN